MGLSRYIDAAFGWLVVTVILLQAVLEWTGAVRVQGPLAVAVLALVAFMALRVGGVGRIFLAVSAVLSAALVVIDPDWQAILWRAVVNTGFFAAFFSALTILRNAAGPSAAMTDAGTFLAQQPPGRRYLALTAGTQVFALLLNYGAIQLLGTLAVSSAKSEPDERIRAIRTRRMLLAIHRGFISSLPWSPMGFAIAIAIAMIPGTSYAQIALPGLITAAIVLGTGWALDTIFKPAVTGARPAPARSTLHWRVLLPLGVLLLVMLIPIVALEWALGIRIVGVVLVLVPLVSMGWIWLQLRDARAFRQRLINYVQHEIPGYKAELLLIVTAGYLGAVGAALVGPLMGRAGIDLGGLPAWALLLGLVWIMPVLGQLGANPILSMSLVAPLLPPAASLGLSPTTFAVALIAGWTMTGVTSPFTATNLLIGRFGGIRPIAVGWVWNRGYFLVTVTLLSAWVLIHGVISAPAG